MKKLLLALMLAFSFSVEAQTVLIDPVAGGGFESGTSLAANGWFSVVPSADVWVVGSVPTPTSSNCGYISSNGGTAWTYSQLSTFSHLYRDVNVPAGELKGVLSFNWKVGGEGTTTSDWDNLKIFLVPITTTPTSTSAVSTTGGTQLSGAGAVSGMYKLSSTTWNSESIIFAFPSAGAWRIVFTWKSDSSDIANPPAALDNISLTSNLPGNFISVATGNWGDATTWNANAVPTALDNVTVSTGNVVTLNVTGQAANNLTVNGTLAYGTPGSFAVAGNLNVNTGGIVNVFSGTTGKTISVAGNIVNNGTVDISVGTTTAGNLTLNGTAVQTVSGTGTFNTNVIRNLTFSNTNTATPNINWLINNTIVAYNLSMTGAKVNLGTNKMTFGNNAVGNSLTAPVGTGFLPGGKFSRYWAATGTGTSVTAGSDPTGTGSRYPFVSTSGAERSMYISRTNATGAVAGELAVVYADSNTMTTGLSLADGTYTVTDRYNGNWAVSNEGTGVSASSYTVAILAQGAFLASNGNSRILGANSIIGGVHQNGTSTPGAQRVTVSQTDLLAAPLYVGISSSDIPFASVASGNWNNPASWNKGVLPSCNDIVQIANTHVITVNSSTNVAKGVTLNSGGNLTVASGDLTVGCTANNNLLNNNGTLTVSGGALNVNGNVSINSGATFNQSGGQINVDGNDNGNVATSVASGTVLFEVKSALGTVNGGTLTIVDPPATGTARSFGFNQTTGNMIWASGHTIKFGNGISSDVSANANGFEFDTYVGTFGTQSLLGSVVVDGGSGTNRWATSTSASINGSFVGGDLTINPSSELRNISGGGTLSVAGNILNNGTFSALTLLSLNSRNTTGGVIAAPNAQTISGSGVFRNLTASPTAGLTSLTVNNASASGVTLNVPLSLSGTLTLTAGKINTTSSNLLTLGTATTAGTLSGGSATAYIVGPFARTISGTNANTNYIHYPVGKTAYAPIWLAPATTAVSNMKAEAFDSNSGTGSASIQNLSTARRWEAPIVSGAVTNINVRLGDGGIQNTNIPVMAPAASGVYTNSFGNTGTYAAGTPNTIQSAAVALVADYTGYLSYAQLDSSLATSEFVSNEKVIKIYPNPFMDILNISDVAKVKSIMISDVSGKIVRNFDKPESTLRLSDLNSGMYLVILNMKDGSKQTMKAIKK